MDYEQLREFISVKMRLTHIYQPLVIKSLIEAGGTATIRQLASILLAQDESQIKYYENRIKRWPLSVLTNHGVINKQGNLLELKVNKMTFQQKAELKRLCEEKMQSYLAKRGMALWDNRLLDNEPISDSMRYRVLKAAKGRCALCGATKETTYLDIDHIIPRSRGGKTTEENLQVLCAKCNRSKGNKDKTDFKEINVDSHIEDCIFCNVSTTHEVLLGNDLCVAFLDRYPVTEGHTLVVPKRHVKDYFEMSELERTAANDLLRARRNQLEKDDNLISGYNFGVNYGESAGQTIDHIHIHLIPRRLGDSKCPRGGVRGVIPGKMNYQQNL